MTWFDNRVDRLLAAQLKVRDAIGSKTPALRDWWAEVAQILQGCIPTVGSEPPVNEVPTELVVVLANLAQTLSKGSIPESVLDVRGPGRPVMPPMVEAAVRLAMAYLQATKPGGISHFGQVIKIRDRSPYRTLRKWFGANEKTIREWDGKYSASIPTLHPLDRIAFGRIIKVAGTRYQRMGGPQSGRKLKRREAAGK